MFFKKKKFKQNIFPDEIIIDSRNMPNFETSQLEGRFERAISKKTFLYFSAALFLIAMFFTSKVFYLQIVRGDELASRSLNNKLRRETLAPMRGVIYDRNNIILAWNGEEERLYADMDGLSHTLGYVGLPSKEDIESDENTLLNMEIGKSGVEKNFEKELRGIVGTALAERDSQGNIISESVQTHPQRGDNIYLSIDAKLQSEMYKILGDTAKNNKFSGGVGIIMDARTGEIISMASWPEYDSQIMSRGKPADKINAFLTDDHKPFLNRAISGLYAPGSVVKPMVAIAALNEGIISPDKQIFSSGSISVQNPFYPEIKSVFKDWKAHGWVDMKRALAVSSDVYFYEIGGGYEEIRGLGINKLEEYAKMFGLGDGTGIDLPNEASGMVPSQEVKKQNNPGDPLWRIGDTYISSIGQGYFLSTPLEIAVYTAAVANNGILLKPRIAKDENLSEYDGKKIKIPDEYFKIVKEGMRMAVTDGTAQGLSRPEVKIAAKTGTAETGAGKRFIHSWIMGFFPYENPKYIFTILLENGPAGTTTGAPYATSLLLDWIAKNAPEYFE
ncbi:MAG: penicillin-binding transpeptidase domain-containing protein [bacterium]|nr:penicillin-binding transpeptidase domain-containing protein [bacterium]